MPLLLLIRHAKSSWDTPHLSDFDRPLNKRGKKNAKELGQWLHQQNLNPDRWLVSSSKRTRHTYERIARKLDKPSPPSCFDYLYHAPALQYCKALQSLPENLSSAALIGHNPGMEDLVITLIGADIQMPTCACFIFEIDSWKTAGKKQAKLVSMWTPKTGPFSSDFFR